PGAMTWRMKMEVSLWAQAETIAPVTSAVPRVTPIFIKMRFIAANPPRKNHPPAGVHALCDRKPAALHGHAGPMHRLPHHESSGLSRAVPNCEQLSLRRHA